MAATRNLHFCWWKKENKGKKSEGTDASMSTEI